MLISSQYSFSIRDTSKNYNDSYTDLPGTPAYLTLYNNNYAIMTVVIKILFCQQLSKIPSDIPLLRYTTDLQSERLIICKKPESKEKHISLIPQEITEYIFDDCPTEEQEFQRALDRNMITPPSRGLIAKIDDIIIGRKIFSKKYTDIIQIPIGEEIFDVGNHKNIFMIYQLSTRTILTLNTPGYAEKQKDKLFLKLTFEREINFLKMLSGTPGILSLQEFVIQQIGRVYATPFYNRFSIYTCIESAQIKGNIQKRDVAIQLLTTLSEIHRKEIIHRDIKPDNCVVDINPDNHKIKAAIIDFGIACSKKNEGEDFYLFAGPPWYLSPESAQIDYSKPHKTWPSLIDTHNDIFAMGWTLLELFCDRAEIPYIIYQTLGEAIQKESGESILKNADDIPAIIRLLIPPNDKIAELFTKILGEFLTLQKQVPDSFIKICLDMLQTDCKKRITAEDALKRFQDIELPAEESSVSAENNKELMEASEEVTTEVTAKRKASLTAEEKNTP